VVPLPNASRPEVSLELLMAANGACSETKLLAAGRVFSALALAAVEKTEWDRIWTNAEKPVPSSQRCRSESGTDGKVTKGR